MPVTQWAGSANSCVNPYIYCFFSKKFRAGFKQLFTPAGRCCCCCRCCCPSSEDGWTRHWDPAAGGAASRTVCTTAAPYRQRNSTVEEDFHFRRGLDMKRATVNQFATCATGIIGIAAAADLTFEATSF